jgi:hypothetical protein
MKAKWAGFFIGIVLSLFFDKSFEFEPIWMRILIQTVFTFFIFMIMAYIIDPESEE